ncbi:MAG: hypothetical protein J6Q54_08005, partial [Oscillospiraceae bacterium]|nr:hypothetical protein [Oscillospiraceae bacterium]
DLIILSSGKTTHPEYAIETEDYNTLSGSVKWVEKIPELYDQILRSRVAPTAYVLSADLPKIDSILDQMDAQFIRYTKLPNNAAVTLQQYYGTTTEAFLTEEKTVVFPNGAYVFTMDQAKGEILALLMEPDVTDLETYKNNLTFQEKIPQDAYGYFGSYRYIHDLEDGQIAYTVAPAAPEGLAATEATYGNTDGRITGLNTAKLYEYRKAGEESYIKVSAGTTEITGLTAGTYYVRYQASGNTLYSADVTLTVECDQLVFVSTAGKDSNAGTEDAPVKTLSGAYSKLPQGGTVVFMDDLSLTGNTIFPVSTYPVTLTSKTGAEGIVTTGSLRMQGNTTFENITVTFNATGLAFISGEGYDLTIGENVTTVNKTGNQVNLVATKRFDAALSANPTLTVKSGTWDFIYATHGNSLTGNVTVNIEGGSCTTVSPSYNATVTGDVNISIKNATVKSLCLEPTHKNGVITGKLHITMGDDADIAASSGSSGVVQGGTTLELVGDVANLGTMTGYGAGSKLLLTSGTWKGTAAEFGQVSLEIAEGKTVTLSSPITADTVTCDGTLDFEGVGSLVAKAITGTVNCTITGRVLKNNLYASVPADADIRFPAEYGMQNDNGNYMIYDLVNFEGLVVKADKAVKVTFYSDAINNNTTYHGRKDYVIQPYATTEENGVVSYYLPNITGLHCYEVSQSGYYT